MSVGILAVIIEAFAPLISIGVAFFIFGGFALAVVTPFLFIVRVGTPKV